MRQETQYCLVCSSKNNLLVDDYEDLAWECWNCHARYWLDDLSIIAYMIANGLDRSEVEFLLNSNDFVDEGIKFAFNNGDNDDYASGMV